MAVNALISSHASLAIPVAGMSVPVPSLVLPPDELTSTPDIMNSNAGDNASGRASGSAAAGIGVRISEWLTAKKKALSRMRDFSPVRVCLWRRGTGGLLDDAVRSGGLAGVDVPPGDYILTFKGSNVLAFSSDVKMPLTLSGRKAEIVKVRNYPDGELVVQVRLYPVQNEVT